MISTEKLLRAVSPELLLAGASGSTALGLLFMVLPLVFKAPIFVIAGMTLGHAFGLAGVLLFAASVLREVLTKVKPSVQDAPTPIPPAASERSLDISVEVALDPPSQDPPEQPGEEQPGEDESKQG